MWCYCMCSLFYFSVVSDSINLNSIEIVYCCDEEVKLLKFECIYYCYIVVFQFWGQNGVLRTEVSDVAIVGALCSSAYSVSSRIDVTRSCEDGVWGRRNSLCTVLLWLQCISSRIAPTRSSEDEGLRSRNSWCSVLWCVQCMPISVWIAVTCIAVMRMWSCAFALTVFYFANFVDRIKLTVISQNLLQLADMTRFQIVLFMYRYH